MCTVTLAVSSVSVAGVNLPVADEMKALGVVLDLAFQKHVMAAARSCNYHSQAIHHIRHLLSRELASTLACSLILTRMDYCNSVLYGTPSSSIQILQRAQNNAARIILRAPRRCHARPLLRNLHWLPIQHRIEYEVAVLTFKSRSSTTAPTYLSRHIKARVSERTLRSSTTPLLDKPFTRTDFANRAFRCAAPTVWNSLPETIIRCATHCLYLSLSLRRTFSTRPLTNTHD